MILWGKIVFLFTKLAIDFPSSFRFNLQASTLTQNDTGPVGPVTPSIYWSCKIFTGPTFFFNIKRKNIG